MSVTRGIGFALTALLAGLPATEQDPQEKQKKPAPKSDSPQSKPTPPPVAKTEALLVVVNAKNAKTNVSMTELRSYFKKERRFWPDGTRTLLCLRRNNSPEMKTLLADVYRWTSKQLRRHWKSKSFRGEITSGKAYTVAPTAANALARVRANPAAITVVLASDLPADAAGVRALTIDGKRSADADYPLQCEVQTAAKPEKSKSP